MKNKDLTFDIFYDLIKDCFMHNLMQFTKSINNDVITLSHTKILKMCEIISDGYVLTSDKNKKDIVSLIMGIDTKAIDAYRNIVHKNFIRIVENALIKMMEEGLINFERCITIVKHDDEDNSYSYTRKGVSRFKNVSYIKASKEQFRSIKEIEEELVKEFMPDFNGEDGGKFIKEKNVYAKYKKRLFEEIYNRCEIDVIDYYDSYEVTLKNKDFNKSENLDKTSSELKDKISIKMIEDISTDENEYDIKKLNDIIIKEDKVFNEKLKYIRYDKHMISQVRDFERDIFILSKHIVSKYSN